MCVSFRSNAIYTRSAKSGTIADSTRFLEIPSKIKGLDAATDQPLPEPTSNAVAAARATALFEIALCSGIPSQFAIAYMFAFAGFTPLTNGELSFGYIATLLLFDATVLIALIFWLLSRQGERPRDVFMGRLPVGPEFRLGVGLTVVVFALAVAVLSAARVLFPALHNVKENPLQQLIQTPMQALILAIVATISGGLREEIQRAFILHRFEQYLGGGRARVGALQPGVRLRPQPAGMGCRAGHDDTRRVLGRGLSHAAQHHRAGRESLGLQRCRNIRVSRYCTIVTSARRRRSAIQAPTSD